MADIDTVRLGQGVVLLHGDEAAQLSTACTATAAPAKALVERRVNALVVINEAGDGRPTQCVWLVRKSLLGHVR